VRLPQRHIPPQARALAHFVIQYFTSPTFLPQEEAKMRTAIRLFAPNKSVPHHAGLLHHLSIVLSANVSNKDTEPAAASQLKSGSSIHATLKKPIDARKHKPGEKGRVATSSTKDGLMIRTQRQRCSSKMCRRAASCAMAVAIVVFGVAVTGTQSARAQTYNVLYSFTGGADGAYPFAPLALDAAGTLYGTTEYGGSHQYGAVFKLDSSGTETVLYSFNVSGTGDGELPFGGLVLDVAGNLYGTTQFGGTFGSGTVFKVDTSGNEDSVAQLHWRRGWR
jgi:uncharacterized repeat protein (TIGR03803 family)